MPDKEIHVVRGDFVRLNKRMLKKAFSIDVDTKMIDVTVSIGSPNNCRNRIVAAA